MLADKETSLTRGLDGGLLDRGDGCALNDVVHNTLFPDIPASLRSRVLARKDVESEDEIAAESLADRLAAGIRGSAFAETSYTEIFG